MKYLLFLLLLIPQLGYCDIQPIKLTENSIGTMPIQVKDDISLQKVRQYFPNYLVQHEIRMGDSPDFHAFIVSTYEGEELFFIISYINTPEDYEKGVVKLDELIVVSPHIRDQYGISPGMPLEVANTRRSSLTFGEGHMDFYFGGGKIWYMVSVTVPEGQLINQQTVTKLNPMIDKLSWPSPWWN